MGLFDALFKKAPKPVGEYKGDWKMLNGYEPHFTTFGGNIYESELVRASIDAIARHLSKLKVETMGAAKPASWLLLQLAGTVLSHTRQTLLPP